MGFEFGLQGVVNKWVKVNKKRVPRSISSTELDRSQRGSEVATHTGDSGDQRQSSSLRSKSKLKQKTRLRGLSKSNHSQESSLDGEGSQSISKSSSQRSSSIVQSDTSISASKRETHLKNKSKSVRRLSGSNNVQQQNTFQAPSDLRVPRRSQPLERSNSQSDLILRDAQKRFTTSSSYRQSHQSVSQRLMDGPISSVSVHSVNSNASVGSISIGSAISGRSVHSVGSGSLSLQQMNAMPWVNEGYDKAMKKRDSTRFRHQHLSSKHYDSMSRDGSVGSRSEGNVSARKHRLLKHMKEHYPQEYTKYGGPISPRQMNGNSSRNLNQSPRRQNAQIVPPPLSITPPPSSSTPPLSTTPPLSELSDEAEIKGNSECISCIEACSKFKMMEEEIHFLRSLAYGSEVCDFCCAPGQTAESDFVLSEHLHESAALKKSSQRLSDTTFRHKRQIEQMSRERVSSFYLIILGRAIILYYLTTHFANF